MLEKIKQNKFQTILVIGLACLYAFLFFDKSTPTINSDHVVQTDAVYLFYSPTCPHCHAAMKFIDEKIKPKYKDIKIKEIDLTNKSNLPLYDIYAKTYGLRPGHRGVPAIYVGDKYMLGYGEDSESGVELESYISKFEPSKTYQIIAKDVVENDNVTKSKMLKVPFLGEIDVFKISLPALSVVLGLLDGFNPCAMWMLAYLISLVAGMHDKKKMWTIVGTFVFAEWVLYFLFMTTWLNVFLFVGYLKPVMLAIGIVALYSSIISLKTFFSGAAIECHIDPEMRKKTMGRIQKTVSVEINSVATFLAVLGLAFVVNSVEFLCSAAIPAVYTNVLANAGISTFMRYVYIFIYNFFYMIDDFIIFGFAVYAINKYVGDKYERYCQLIGGVILAILGVGILFFPEYLR